MSRVLASLAVLILAAGAARAQPVTPPSAGPDGPVTTAPAPPPPAPLVAPPARVEVLPLAAPDAFSTAARPTGLPPTLWAGTSPDLLRTVLPLLVERPLSPAAAALARRVLATGAQAPKGIGDDPAILAARASALMAQGDPKGAAAILARAPGLDRSPDLARVAAESALLAGEDDRACRIESNLAAGRDDIYWVRLRTYCQAIAGKAAEAQLTLDLAQSQAADPVFARLMAAKIAGVGNPGAPALRNGLDYALSRNLGLDLSAAKPAPAVAAALASADAGEPAFDAAALPPELAGVAQAIAARGVLPAVELDRLLDAANVRDAKVRTRLSAAALIVLPLVDEMGPTLRARIAALPTPEGKVPAGRNLALEAAGQGPIKGEAALIALWTCAEAGPSGLAPADRARIVLALRQAGFDRDARAFALEGLAALK